MPIDATVGGADSNSFATVAEADAYFEFRLFAELWDDASTATKEKALVTAARIITARVKEDWTLTQLPGDATIKILTDVGDDASTYLVWKGVKADQDQAIPWPRSGIADVADDVIPDEIKALQFEVALLSLGGDRTVENAPTAQGLTGLTAGPVSLSWKDGAPNPRLIPVALLQTLPASWWYAFRLEQRYRASVEII